MINNRIVSAVRNLCFTLVVLFLITGCDDLKLKQRYTGSSDSHGKYFVLDGETGNLRVFNGEFLVAIPNDQNFGSVKKFNNSDISGIPIIVSDVKIKYRNGELLYTGYLEPKGLFSEAGDNSESGKEMNKILRKAFFDYFDNKWDASSKYRYIELIFTDDDGFSVDTVRITRDSLTRTVDKDGTPIYFSFKSSASISAKSYEEIDYFTLNWNLPEFDSK